MIEFAGVARARRTMGDVVLSDCGRRSEVALRESVDGTRSLDADIIVEEKRDLD
jgi:hypothetical protein